MAQSLFRRHLMVSVMLILAGIGWLIEAHLDVFEWFHSASRPYEHFALDGLAPGALLVLLGAFLDTYRAHQEACRERERLRVMVEMAATVAHEINDPLTTLVAQIELAEEDLSSDDPVQARLAAMRAETWRIVDRIERLGAVREYRPREVGVGPRLIDLSQ